MPNHFLPGGYPNPDPYYISPEEEAALEKADECQHCDHGRVLVFYCIGHCECGYCPDVEDCPECMGQEPTEGEAWPPGLVPGSG